MNKEIILFVVDAVFESLKAYVASKPVVGTFLLPIIEKLHQMARDRLGDILKRSNAAIKSAGIRASFTKE